MTTVFCADGDTLMADSGPVLVGWWFGPPLYFVTSSFMSVTTYNVYGISIYTLPIQSMCVAEMKIETKGYATINKTAMKSGNSTSIYLPNTWQNKKVLAILLEPENEPNKSD